MISKTILDQAKAFLSWDTFSNLTIQLIELKEPAAYFYPPSSSQSTIVIFYPVGENDFSKPLYLLFHEAGHYIQYKERENTERESEFWEMVNTPTGMKKLNFENESWQKGRELLESFINKNGMEISVLEEYDNYSKQSIESYK